MPLAIQIQQHGGPEQMHLVDLVVGQPGPGEVRTFERSLDVLRPFGLLVSFGNASGPVPPFSPAILGTKGSLYVTRGALFTHLATREGTRAMADDLFAVVQSGALKIRIGQRYPLAEAPRAHVELEARETTGGSILLP